MTDPRDVGDPNSASRISLGQNVDRGYYSERRMQTVWGYGQSLCIARRTNSQPRFTLIDRHKAGRGGGTYPVIASFQLALKDK
jgi:hypothetical protein